ncbi:hypothetical protein PR202_ga08941 [Eleusine coracana subsp. coracana]|uniref:Late embryogenesis abundant protein LEA-2 subgroup domain-containing protein n=1 Tax=Eleusine coracana subsp. coracana TaxID=191504 RepID=A0AAV5C3H5_ELECO|nr:hypothetical protein QOZ80_1AG0040930 [Eleusine coracana subsp. coracana]GJM92465.1 hypothetical protein PR202_ga08941 [Eleusine coracana subsp. coracana]
MAAAYEKPQQPQASQPTPHLNAAYYGPAIPPPQPAYYGPPPSAPRRSCFGLLCKIIAIVIIALGVTTLVLWLIFRPDILKAITDSATLSRFDLVNGAGSNGGDRLQHNLTVNIRLRNPNRFGIRYDYVEARAAYDDERFGFALLPSFYLNSKSDQTITATFNREAVLGNDDDLRQTYQREKREGFYYVKVWVYTNLSFRVRIVRRSHYKSKITCMLRLPVPTGGNAGPAPITNLGTKCDVDF